MPDRRTFMKTVSLASLAMSPNSSFYQGSEARNPLIISTWPFGAQANQKTFQVLNQGKSLLDAVELGVRAVEADPAVTTVGYGGLPDEEGKVTLDACIMEGSGGGRGHGLGRGNSQIRGEFFGGGIDEAGKISSRGLPAHRGTDSTQASANSKE